MEGRKVLLQEERAASDVQTGRPSSVIEICIDQEKQAQSRVQAKLFPKV